jgi:type IV secretion system protein TrbC
MKKRMMVGVVGLLRLLDAAPALAFSATGMPWDGPFQNLLNGLQGGLAHALVAIGIIVAGIGWTFWQEFNPAMRALIGVVGGGAVAIFAIQLMTVLGLGGFML